jgi:hypothetical protein
LAERTEDKSDGQIGVSARLTDDEMSKVKGERGIKDRLYGIPV